MALVYTQDMSHAAPASGGCNGNILNYSTREQQAIGGGGAGGNSNDCSVQHLCYEPSPLCNSTNEYPSTITTITHELSGNESSSLLNYSINSVAMCPLYCPPLSEQAIGGGNNQDSLHPGLQQPPPPPSSDDVCFMMEPCTGESGTAIQGSNGQQQQQSLSWQAFKVDSWYCMSDRSMQDINHDEVTCGFAVEADKGFNYSQWDESFVCQKKNHFQISVQLKLPRVPKYVKTNANGHKLELINCFGLHLYGMKFEAPESIIMIEMSRTDRSKLPYESLLIDLPNFPDQLVKASACRLHFSETTANNMRKRGKPNPDQRYFSLVVSLHAYTSTGNYPVVAYVSERIIVRASNPGQFDNEGDATWLKGASSSGSDTVFYQGKVGINTESPDEALTVVGNVQVTGQILQPSDARLKTDITQINTSEMLTNVERLTLYSYVFKYGAFGEEKEKEVTKEVGLLAQEVKKVIPDAVKTMVIKGKDDTILVLNKDRLLMESLGAIQELNGKNKRTLHLIAILAILFSSLLCVLIVIGLYHLK
ncbi:PREDICTED: myelin regulatory factor-like [Amphimedon queenslandica]|uniref:NDT80 domain-containing protein n=1 Tax=Amphimedon queenslandica TaxID=400682 RepID=A0A1X7V5D4_AMPQE|nr:PREDICTED: myelin regulatory factor-like [Amphimedon queenslandica]|eukprot:XP_003385638.1 PREDICTED: myelin regulatory factor-like [Amphimedon queenslandica]